jgi:hypothetical protein
MIQTATGISDDIDLALALEDVIDQCRQQLGTIRPQAGILFSSCLDADFPKVLSRILEEYPDIQLIGCTSAGEISHHTGFIEDSIALLLLYSDTLEFVTAIATNLSQNAEESFRIAYLDACKILKKKPACAFTFPDSLTTNGIALDETIRHAFGDSFPVFGGTSGNHNLSSCRYQFHNNRVYTNAAPILIVAGEMKITSAVGNGPLPIGDHFALGRRENNVVYEIDGKPATTFFREHLDGFLEHISEFPLAVYAKDQKRYFLRAPLLLNEEDGSVTFIGTFPKDCSVCLTFASRKIVLDAAEQANHYILGENSGMDPELIIIFSCSWMRHILGSKTNDKFALFRQTARNVPFFGFYGYGEIAPFSPGSPSLFHNQSYVAIALSTRNM